MSTPSAATGLPGIALFPGWLGQGEAGALFDALIETVPWSVHRLRLFGREIDSPRLSCWMGDEGASYRYSGTRFTPHPWLPALAAVRARLDREFDAGFNSVLANLYRDGRDAMGWHADAERELGPEPVIASLSLGAPRRFVLRHRARGLRHELVLEPGSLLLMRGRTQAHWQHALPRAKDAAPRINLTFRRIFPD